MPYVDWADLTDRQKAEVLEVNPGRYEQFTTDHAFWVKKDGSVSRKKGHSILSRAGHERFKKLYEETQQAVKNLNTSHVRPEKGDLEAWKPGTTFHLSKG